MELGNDTNFVVDFEGPDDPARPVNWPPFRKWLIVFMLAAMSFIASLSAAISAPAIHQAIEEFGSSSELLAALTISVYNIGLAIGPIVVAPMSEVYGRLIPYHITNLLFTLFTIGCAASPTLSALIVFRMFAGMQASSVLTVGGATVGDLFTQEHRGRAMAIWTFGPLMGPAVGPVVGGYLAEAKGWRWVFWLVAIIAAAIVIVFFLTVRETYTPVLLKHKVKKLRRQTGISQYRSAMADGPSSWDRLARASARPLILLFRTPTVFLLSLFIAVVFSYQYLLFVTIPTVFGETYGFSTGEVGLAYLGVAVGLLIGNAVFGYASDGILSRRANGKEMKPEYRLPLLVPGAFAIPACFFIYGWTTHFEVHWIVPICATALLGLGVNLSLMAIQVYLVDAYTLYSASALAAATILRSFAGAFLPLSGPPLYEALGLGWGNSTLAFVALALVPIPFLFIRYGESLRTNPRFQPKL